MASASLRRHLGPAALMGGGMVVVGLAGYGFLALSGHTMPTSAAAPIASFYLILSIVGPGIFSGLEQETSRSTSAWLTTGRPVGVIARRAALVGAGLLVVVLVALGAVSPVLTGKALAGNWGLFLAVVVGAILSAVLYLVRGVLGATRRFTGYAVSLAGEGLSRIVLCVLVVAIGLTDPTVYSLVFAAGAGFAVLVAWPWLRRRAADPAAPAAELEDDDPADETVSAMARGLGLLVGATLGFQTVANLAPILVTARLAADTATAAAFASAFVLVRIPVLLFAAVQAMLLPALTRAATNRDGPAVLAMLRKIMLVVAAIGVPTVLGAVLLGPWAVEFLFGAKVRLSHTVVGLLAVGTVLLMITQVLMPALVALGRHHVVLAAWAVGGVVLIGVLVLAANPVNLAVLAQLLACGLVVAIMLLGLTGPLRRLVRNDDVKVPALTS